MDEQKVENFRKKIRENIGNIDDSEVIINKILKLGLQNIKNLYVKALIAAMVIYTRVESNNSINFDDIYEKLFTDLDKKEKYKLVIYSYLQRINTINNQN